MTATGVTDKGTVITDEVVDRLIMIDPNDPGRHYARFVEYGTHVFAVLNDLRRTGGNVIEDGDVAEAAVGWHMSEDAVRAAIRYYERHRDLFDAYFLPQDEVDRAWDDV